ncbi:hypothetical protein KSP39_PZI024082 [Platanthera zijinensis]|uniref:Uncharacterized protein n=1 Tax=Platanthera zijinensis TaxID=2320716 RepID=A0AAP0ASF3_9ASPA
MASMKAEKPANCQPSQVPLGQPIKEPVKAPDLKPKAVPAKPTPKVEQKPRAPTKIQVYHINSSG